MKYETRILHVDLCSCGTPIIIAVYLYGNPNGYPVIHLHGGPGANVNHEISQFYDLQKYRLVMFDQRGCGNSKPRLLIEKNKNTTQLLIRDIEQIRTSVMCCQKWLVSGGSWGSALAVLYAQSHPAHTSGLLLRGFTDLINDETNSVFSHIFPDHNQEFFKIVNLNHQKHNETLLVKKLYKRLKQSLPSKNIYNLKKSQKHILNQLTKKDKYFLLNLFSDNQVYTLQNIKNEQNYIKKKIQNMTASQKRKFKQKVKTYKNKYKASGSCSQYHHLNTYNNENKIFQTFADALITYHYASNNYFIQKNQIISKININKIKHIPTIFVQGRFDIVCPLERAWNMHQQLPKSELLIAHAGHSNQDDEIIELLKKSTHKFIKILNIK